jgi:hypothetical protein
VTLEMGLLAAVAAVAAAVRSTWSPCGLSMLSTITPLAEQGRGYRYRSTALWFVAGALTGGAILGLGTAMLAGLVDLVDLSPRGALAVGGALAVAAAAIDLGLLGPHIPHHRRQVNELWLGRYRSWVYGAGFGLQIGTGLATYIMTAAVYLTIGLAALTGSPWAAFGVAIIFAGVRAAAIFLSAGLTTPQRLTAFHRRFDALAEPVRRLVIGVELVIAATVATAVWGIAGLLGALVVTAVLMGATVLAQGSTQRQPALRSPQRVASSPAGVDPGLASRPVTAVMAQSSER